MTRPHWGQPRRPSTTDANSPAERRIAVGRDRDIRRGNPYGAVLDGVDGLPAYELEVPFRLTHSPRNFLGRTPSAFPYCGQWPLAPANEPPQHTFPKLLRDSNGSPRARPPRISQRALRRGAHPERLQIVRPLICGIAIAASLYGPDLTSQAATTAAGPPGPAGPAGPAVASYVAVSVNGGKLPSRDKVSDKDGTQYVVEFDELVLAIRPAMQFRAALRYRQTLALKGAAIERDPIQRMTVYGRYEVRGNTLRFVPDPKRGGKGIQILDGTFSSGRI